MDMTLKQLIKHILTEEVVDPEQENIVDILARFKKEAEDETTVANEEEEQSKLAKEANDNKVEEAFGNESVISKESQEIEKPNTKIIIPIISLYNNIKNSGIDSMSLLAKGSENTVEEVSKTIAKSIVEYRKNPNIQRKLQQAFEQGIKPNPSNYLNEEQLISNLKVSLIRCKLYFWTALNIYREPEVFVKSSSKEQKEAEKSGIVSADSGDNIKTSYPSLNYSKIFTELMNPSDKELDSVYYMFRELASNQYSNDISELQKIILSKNDLLTKFLSKKIKLQQASSIQNTIKEAIQRPSFDYNNIKKAADRIKKEQELQGREVAKSETPIGSVDVEKPSNYTGDAVSKTDELRNKLFDRYFNTLISEYFYATTENISKIDERIYEKLANPISLNLFFKGRRLSGQKYETKGLDTTSSKDKNIILRNATTSIEDIENTESATITNKEAYLLNNKNLFHEYFNSTNYTSCVGEFLEKWSKQSDKFLVKIFDKQSNNLVDINLLEYLYKQSSHYLPTSGTAITELQIDILSCARHLITLDGEPANVSESNFSEFYSELYGLVVSKYKLQEFTFAGTNNTTKEAARQAFGLEEMGTIETSNERSFGRWAEKGTFKDRLLIKINSITDPAFENIKENVIEQLETITDHGKILDISIRLIGEVATENLLRGSSDEKLYRVANKSELTVLSKELAKKLDGIMVLDPVNTSDITTYIITQNFKIGKKELLNWLLTSDIASCEKLKTEITQTPKFKALAPRKVASQTAIIASFDALILEKKKAAGLTESLEQEQRVSDILRQAAIKAFATSLIPNLQFIGKELNKFGRFLINLSQYPEYYIDTIKKTEESARKFRSALRNFLLPISRIKQLVEIYEEIKDVMEEELSPLDNPVFKNNFSRIKSWLLEFFKMDNNLKVKMAIKIAEEENDWKPLKQLLYDNWDVIVKRLSDSNGNLTSIGKLISGLIFKSAAYAKPYKSTTGSEEEDLKNQELLKKAGVKLKSSRFASL
jgi:hypothetical protein